MTQAFIQDFPYRRKKKRMSHKYHIPSKSKLINQTKRNRKNSFETLKNEQIEFSSVHMLFICISHIFFSLVYLFMGKPTNLIVQVKLEQMYAEKVLFYKIQFYDYCRAYFNSNFFSLPNFASSASESAVLYDAFYQNVDYFFSENKKLGRHTHSFYGKEEF